MRRCPRCSCPSCATQYAIAHKHFGAQMVPGVTRRYRMRHRFRYTRYMPMRATTVRFGDELWRLLEREAQRDGVSAAQFIRDATILRVAYAMGQRGDSDFERALGRTTAPDHAGPAETASERRQALLDAAVRDPDRLDALRATGLLDSDIA